jgi:hypothetical protein
VKRGGETALFHRVDRVAALTFAPRKPTAEDLE